MNGCDGVCLTRDDIESWDDATVLLLLGPCVRCDPWTPRDASEADLDRWQAFADSLPSGPHLVEVGHGVTVTYPRSR